MIAWHKIEAGPIKNVARNKDTRLGSQNPSIGGTATDNDHRRQFMSPCQAG
jgi:hypothetical protein